MLSGFFNGPIFFLGLLEKTSSSPIYTALSSPSKPTLSSLSLSYAYNFSLIYFGETLFRVDHTLLLGNEWSSSYSSTAFLNCAEPYVLAPERRCDLMRFNKAVGRYGEALIAWLIPLLFFPLQFLLFLPRLNLCKQN